MQVKKCWSGYLTRSGSALIEQKLPGGKHLSGRYAVWRGQEYDVGAVDRKRARVPIYFYGPEPAGMGFDRDGRHPDQRWPWWSRWVPVDEIEKAYKVSSRGVWREAEFFIHAMNSNGEINIEGPTRQYGEHKPISWWLGLPGFESSDFRRAEGWVPLSEVTDVSEVITEMKL